MQIQTSLDWSEAQRELEAPLLIMKYSNAKQLRFMLMQLNSLVRELGNEEIRCRQKQRQTVKHKELITKINEYIEYYEGLVTFATLVG